MSLQSMCCVWYVCAYLLHGFHHPRQIYEYLRTKEDFLTRFLTHLGTSAMMDLLLQMVAAPDNDQCRVDIAVVS